MVFTKRDILIMYVYGILTLGIYFIYWEVKTKREINREFNADIPTCWLLIIPIANIYWLYRFTEAYVTKVKCEDDTVIWFIIFWLIGIVMPYFVQKEINELIDNPMLLKNRKLGYSDIDRICPKCNRAIPVDSNICPYCGNKFETYI